ncbi:MAG: arsenate reductase ArsC [Candidatus Methanofastidiosa archaeon]|nr:arsenate reductase ArsC [Candidatus Methanofastidiosa archaeon]
MPDKKKVLFICVHNSARSIIAESLLNSMAGHRFAAESAGLNPTEVHPLTIEVLKEEGIDVSDHKTKSVFDIFKEGRLYNAVITVCEKSKEAKCPIFPGVAYRDHWPFEDPLNFEGTYEERLENMRKVKEDIRKRLNSFIECICHIEK